jgi:hypothetical protein
VPAACDIDRLRAELASRRAVLTKAEHAVAKQTRKLDHARREAEGQRMRVDDLRRELDIGAAGDAAGGRADGSDAALIEAADELERLRARVHRREVNLLRRERDLDTAVRAISVLEPRLEAEQRRRARRRRQQVAVTAVVAVAVGIALLLWIDSVGERRPGATAAAGVFVAAIVAAPFAVHALRHRTLDVLAIPGAAGALLWLASFVVLPVYAAYKSHQHGSLADYCHYGSVSKAQFEGCMRHADGDAIYRLDTNAAQFARRDLEECRADAGPMCEAALNYRLLADQAPDRP